MSLSCTSSACEFKGSLDRIHVGFMFLERYAKAKAPRIRSSRMTSDARWSVNSSSANAVRSRVPWSSYSDKVKVAAGCGRTRWEPWLAAT
jgi:hypothetical protein